MIVKLGGGGVYMKSGGKTVRLPAYAVDAVDSTGAGDNFSAGFISELLMGKSPEEALSFANACGAVCVTALGGGNRPEKPGTGPEIYGGDAAENDERFRAGRMIAPCPSGLSAASEKPLPRLFYSSSKVNRSKVIFASLSGILKSKYTARRPISAASSGTVTSAAPGSIVAAAISFP